MLITISSDCTEKQENKSVLITILKSRESSSDCTEKQENFNSLSITGNND